jgi:hypothetical protein
MSIPAAPVRGPQHEVAKLSARTKQWHPQRRFGVGYGQLRHFLRTSHLTSHLAVAGACLTESGRIRTEPVPRQLVRPR